MGVSTTPVMATGYAFDDVLLLPGYADFTRDDVELSTRVTKNIRIAIPFVSSPMDTVTGSRLAIAIAKAGGLGILHRNLRIADQVSEVKKVKHADCLSGAAIGVGEGAQERIAALAGAGVDVICIDAAHGYTSHMLRTIKYIKKQYPRVQVIAGNVATYEGAKALAKAGADAVRVGMGPGSICTTRIVSGMGVPQLTAILETSRAAAEYDIPVIADGGIKHSGDIVKALAAGASSVMMGGFLAGSAETPGTVVKLTADQVPSRYKRLLKQGVKSYAFKQYRGMGSVGAMQKGAQVNAEDEFHGKSFKDQVLVTEGVESLVPFKGTIQDICDQAIGGIRSGMFYVGVKTITELQKKAQFIQLTQASLVESHPHDVVITNPGSNY